MRKPVRLTKHNKTTVKSKHQEWVREKCCNLRSRQTVNTPGSLLQIDVLIVFPIHMYMKLTFPFRSCQE